MISQELTTFAETMSLWSSGRRGSESSLSNLFPSESAIKRWSSAGVLRGVSVDGASLILREDRDFVHAYLHCSDHDAGCSLLKALDRDIVVVADVLDKRESHAALAETFRSSGFRPYRQLMRISRPPLPLMNAPTLADVVDNARPSDADVILRQLEEHFDRYSEQLPSLAEVHDAIRSGLILVARHDGGVAGFLHFEHSGQMSAIRYWFVLPHWRDGRVGASLLRTYLGVRCADDIAPLGRGRQRWCHRSLPPLWLCVRRPDGSGADERRTQVNERILEILLETPS